ncbi:ATP-binding protein [Actinacidiphila bryophytorum]|uniref:ATP-binding protein n=1 Tax=Actinacidiphila bryophytorum TaxID=1436133 RepID=UPI00195F6716|nr:ATP-binding protein [Actinacidiphila bryophytorum]MBM9439029.1 ATP-binding protein [Actinacidiphila bryophytorum]MBN6544041.1 ATP-binding protein [Actinacidiphila bryophytorum]
MSSERLRHAVCDGETVAQQWPQSAASVRSARGQLRETLQLWGLVELVDDSTLVLSELLSNAVEHSRNGDGTVGTRFRRLAGGCGVRIEVHDADAARLPRMSPATDCDDLRGRGLRIVNACTRRNWGVDVTSEGKAVWGEVEQ